MSASTGADPASLPAEAIPSDEELRALVPTGTPIGMARPKSLQLTLPAVVDPGADACRAIEQSALVGAALFGASPVDGDGRRKTAIDFTRAIGYVLGLLQADGEIVAAFRSVAAQAESSGQQADLWRSMLRVYERYGARIDAAVDPAVSTCPNLSWFPPRNSPQVVANLKRTLSS